MPLSRRRCSRPSSSLAIAGLVVAAACVNGKLVDRQPDRYDREALAEALEGLDSEAGLVLGVYPLASGAVVDGDTIQVEGLDASLRLLGLDTEETFKSDEDLRLYEGLGFARYLENERGDSTRPVKAATPVGMQAKHFAADFFRGVTRVRLERDHPKEVRGRYGRHLAYVFVEREGVWLNYNLECVRAGMSPYFTKYGYSRRFHDAFVQAQQEARAQGRGIWDPQLEHYPDYEERLRWWNARADFIAAFEKDASAHEDRIVLTHWDSLKRLAEAEGDEVWVLATVSEIRTAEENAPTRVFLGRRMFADFPLVFFDDRVFDRSGIQDAAGEFVVVRGTVSTHTFKGKGRRRRTPSKQLQIVVRRPEQIVAANASSRLLASSPGTPPEPPPPAGVGEPVGTPPSGTP